MQGNFSPEASPTKNRDSSETETEPETILTEEKYNDSINFTFGKVKNKAPVNKAKSAAEMRKRIIVGFFVLALYVIPMFVHPLFLVLVSAQIAFTMISEAFEISSKPFERTIYYRVLRYSLELLALFYLMPIYGPLERNIMEASGYS